MLKLERVYYPQIHSSISIPEEGSIEIENKFSLNVKFDSQHKKCISTLETKSTCNMHEDWFSVLLRIVGIFSFDRIDSDEDLKHIHAESYDMLFPYAQSMMSELTTKSGIPPLMLEKVPMDFGVIKLSRE